VARRYGISSGLLYTWRRHLLEGSLGVTRQPVAKFARVEVMAMPADPAPALSLAVTMNIGPLVLTNFGPPSGV
jgi:transposase-like protein